MDKSPFRYGKPKTIFEAGKLVGGQAFVLVEWLKTLKEAIEKARAFCLQKRPKRKRKRASGKPREPRPLTAASGGRSDCRGV